MRIVIAICTYNRPLGLKRALMSLAKLRTQDDFEIEFVVVDNSTDGNARALLEEMRESLPWEAVYIHEAKPGISCARNAGLEHALAQSFDFMVGIDDDMHADENWLIELTSVATKTRAEAVMSYQEFECSGEMSWWVDEAYRLDRREPASYRPDQASDGTEPDSDSTEQADDMSLEQGSTGGCLIRLDYVRSINLRFDEDYGKSGGEDSMFFDQLRSEGGRIIYAPKAIVYEVVGTERMTVHWWVKRWYRTGNTTGLVSLVSNRKTRLRVFLDGLLRIILGFVGTIVSLPWLLLQHAKGMRAVRMLCRGTGYVAAAIGVRYDEYSRARLDE